MNTEDKNKFKEVMTMISINYNEEIGNAKLKLWWTLFNHHPIETFEKGVFLHISCPDAGMFSPKPANITRMIQGTSKQNDQDIESEAELAWASVFNAIKGCGSHRTPSFKNPRIAPTLFSMIDWMNLCACTMKELDWKKKEFISLYSTITKAEVGRLTGELRGRVELEQHKEEEKGKVFDLMKGLEQRNLGVNDE